MNLHESAKREKLKMRVANTRQKKEECDKSSSSPFILIKKDPADIMQEISSPHREMVMTSPALQCKDEGWRRCVSMRGGTERAWERAGAPPGAWSPTCTGGSMTHGCPPRSRLALTHWQFALLVFLLK